MKRIFEKKAVAAAIAVLFSVSLVCTGCSDGGSSGSDDSGGGTNVSGGDGSGGETGGFGTEKPTIADGTYCDGMLTVKNGSVTKCDPNATGTIEIPEGVTSIGDNAFRDCKNLTSIIIPSSVTEIDPSAFSGCTNLKEIKVDENNSNYFSVSGILFNKNRTVLVAYPSAAGSVTTLPSSVTTIGSYAFAYCTGLTSMTIPYRVTSIDYSAFSGCTSLTSITIPDSVTKIGNWAFNGCTSLTSITIPDSVTEIDPSAFSGCTNLKEIKVDENNSDYFSAGGILFNKDRTELVAYPSAAGSVTIPEGVIKIEMYAFEKCKNLTNVTIPKSVWKIGDHAFIDCTSLTSVTILGTVVRAYIGNQVFEFCKNLKTIYVANETAKEEWTESAIGVSGVTVEVKK